MNRSTLIHIRHLQLEGFRPGVAVCCHCSFRWIAVPHPDAVAWKLDCPACHWAAPGITQSNNHFTEFEPITAAHFQTDAL